MNHSIKMRILELATFLCLLVIHPSAALGEPPWEFIIVGDSRGGDNGVNVSILSEIADEIVAHNVDFVLFPGDLVNGYVDQAAMESQLTTWRETMQVVYDAGIGVYPVRGNHDVGDPAGLASWNNVFTGDYALPTNGPIGEVGVTYSVTHKNAFVLALDQYVTFRRVNQAWVNSQLLGNQQPHVFALGHEPAFQVQHADCLDDYPAERDAFWTSLKNAGCNIYACGHDHFFDHAIVDDGDGNPNNDIHQYVVGTGGAPLRSWLPPYNGDNGSMAVEQWNHSGMYGYVLVEVVDDVTVTMTWYERGLTGEYGPVVGQRDLDSNGIVNLSDFAIFRRNWLRHDCRPANSFCDSADIDQLNSVDIRDFILLSQLWLEHVPFETMVITGNDDAEENNSTHAVSLTSTDLELVTESDNQTVGIRFDNINILRGATIATAYIQFTVDEDVNISPCSLTIKAQAADNATQFTGASADITSRTTTAASVAWNNIPQWTTVGETGPDQQTPDIAAVIQEVVDRPGFAPGNAIVIIITDSGKRVAESYDGSPLAAPLLNITLQ